MIILETYFRNLPLFEDFHTNDFKEKDFQQFFQDIEEITLNENNILIKQGTRNNHLFFLKDGLLDVFITGPKEYVYFIEIRKPLAIIGEMELFDKRPVITNIRAKTGCTLYKIGYSSFKRLLKERPSINQKLLKIAHSKWRNIEIGIHQVISSMTESNEYLSNFARTVSHDLKSPLVSIIGFAHILEMNHEKPDAFPDSLDYIYKIEQNARKMGELIDGILKYSAAIHHSPEDFRPTNIKEVILEVVQLLNPSPDIKIRIIDPIPVIVAYKIQMAQVFQNLIDNAIKNLNKTEKSIEIKCRSTRDFWEFSIKDNGIGIKEENYEQIMKIFQRVDSSVKYSGTGIGLTIIERIVNIHRGKLWVESEYGKSSTFYFTISKKIIQYTKSD